MDDLKRLLRHAARAHQPGRARILARVTRGMSATPRPLTALTVARATATLRSLRIHGDSSGKIKPCVRYTGNNTGAEPVRTGSGPDGTYCRYTASDITYE